MPEPSSSVAELIRVLEILAAGPASQRAYLEQLGTWPSLDELALELDDLRGTDPQQSAATLGPADNVLRELDTMLREMSEASADLWEGPALATDERWAAVRRLAKHALDPTTSAVAS